MRTEGSGGETEGRPLAEYRQEADSYPLIRLFPLNLPG